MWLPFALGKVLGKSRATEGTLLSVPLKTIPIHCLDIDPEGVEDGDPLWWVHWQPMASLTFCSMQAFLGHGGAQVTLEDTCPDTVVPAVGPLIRP